MSHPFRNAAFLWVVLLAAGAVASAQGAAPTITWLVIDYPPYSILHGRDAGQGIADSLVQLLDAHLVGWTSRHEPGDPATIMARMKAGERVCSVPYIRTPERERVLAFSLPAMISPPVAITVRRRQLASFGGGAPVSLESLLDNPRLRLAVALGRSYSPRIDSVLEGHRAAPNVYWRRGPDVYSGLFDLLAKGSVDYILGLPEEALYLARQHGMEGELTNVPLVESSDYLVGHVVCPNNAWGRHMATIIDAILVAQRSTPAYRQLMERWVDDGMKQQFRRQYDAKLAQSH